VGKRVKKVKQSIAVSDNHLTTTGNHMSHGITQCYLPLGSSDFWKLVVDLVTPEGCKAECLHQHYYRQLIALTTELQLLLINTVA